MPNYLAITIGPIYDTMQYARNTREIWASSNIFSKLMDLLMSEVQSIGGKVILPIRVSATEERYGAGVYNDRLFAELDATLNQAVPGAIDNVISKLAAALDPKKESGDAAFWKSYLRIKWACIPIDKLDNGALFSQINPVLDAAELHTPYFNDAPNQHRLLEMFEDTNIYKTLLADALKGESRGKYAGLMRGLFPSTTDIATFSLFQQNQTIYNQLSEAAELGQGNEGKQMDKFYELLLRDQGVFKNKVFDYHKYFCVVHADGDNLGKLGNTLTDAASYQVLSKKLATYAIEAANIINEHGGKPVYIGGDDLLFFAPVCSVVGGKTQSVLHLIQHLREAYDNLETGTTISFGITLTYYKFPLFAARELSYEQLFYHAKKAVSKDGVAKNAIAFRLVRHSGAWFEGLLSNDMLIQFINTETAIRSLNKDMMSGIVQKMDTLSPLMDSVAQRDISDDRFKYLLENFFNEPIHRNNKNEMELVGKLMHETYKTGYISGKEMGNKNLYAILRLLKFVSDQSKPEQGRQQAPQANNQAQQNN